MKSLRTILEGSLLDDIEDTLSTGDVNVPRALVLEYLEDNYLGNWIISEKPNKDGLYEVGSNNAVFVKHAKLTSLTNDLFIWTNVKGDFNCAGCKSLKTLEGAPERVDGSFDCSYCNSLKTLVGAPEIVNGNFNCSGCNSLKTLEGVPKKVVYVLDCSDCKSLEFLKGAPKKLKGSFYCNNCPSLKSLKGAPEIVNSFDCAGCKSLKTLEGAPEIVKGNFYCSDCGKVFTKDDIQRESKVNGIFIW